MQTPIDLIVLDPHGCESCISLISDLMFVTVDVALLDLNYLKIASSLLSNSSLILSILSSFFCSISCVHTWISLLN